MVFQNLISYILCLSLNARGKYSFKKSNKLTNGIDLRTNNKYNSLKLGQLTDQMFHRWLTALLYQMGKTFDQFYHKILRILKEIAQRIFLQINHMVQLIMKAMNRNEIEKSNE